MSKPTAMAVLAVCYFIASSSAKEPPGDSHSKSAEVFLFNGKSLDGWKVAEKFDFEHHGSVAVKDGAIVLNRGKPATGIVGTQKELPRINYEISLEAKRVDGSDFFCGLTFPVGDDYCSLILGGWGGDVTGLSNVDNFSAAENVTTSFVNFKENQWYKIRLRVTDTKIEAWVDDEQIVDLETADRKFSIWWEQEPMRPLGIATWNTTGALRNVVLRNLEPAGDQVQR